MLRKSIVTVTLALASLIARAQQPQRTLVSAPTGDSTPQPRQSAASEASIRSAVASYRQYWDRLGSKRQKMMLKNGSYTPEQYEQMLRQTGRANQSTRVRLDAFLGEEARSNPEATRAESLPDAPPDRNRGASVNVLHSIGNSTEDLNAIRDGNLQRVQKDSCPPQVSSRVAELRSRLAEYESVTRDDAQPGTQPAPAARTASAGRPEVVAGVAEDWYNNPAERQPNARDSSNPELDAVLGGGHPDAAPAPTASSKPADSIKRRRDAEEEVSRLKVELEHLSGACPAGR